jgi:hypothetical protein
MFDVFKIIQYYYLLILPSNFFLSEFVYYHQKSQNRIFRLQILQMIDTFLFFYSNFIYFFINSLKHKAFLKIINQNEKLQWNLLQKTKNVYELVQEK